MPDDASNLTSDSAPTAISAGSNAGSTETRHLLPHSKAVYLLSDPSGTDLSLVFSTSPSSPSSPRPVSDYYYKCLIYHIQA